MPAVDVDLHAARLPFLRQELASTGKLLPTISSVSQSFIMSQLGFGAEQADRAGDERQVVGHARPCRAAPWRRRRRACRRPRSPRRPRAARPAPTRIATRSPALSTSAARCEVRVARARRAASVKPTPEWTVPCSRGGARRRRSSCRSFGTMMQVTVRSASAMRTARSTRCAHLLGRRRHLHVLVRDVLEQRQQVDLLLVVAAERGARLLADDGDDRLMVQLARRTGR